MWPAYALIAMLCFAAMQLIFKQLTRLGLSSPAILVFVFAFGALCFTIHVIVFRTALPITTTGLTYLIAAGVLGYVGNLCSVRAIGVAPNPGYVVAIVSLQTVVVAGAAVALFGAALTWTKIAGIVLGLLGLVLLVI